MSLESGSQLSSGLVVQGAVLARLLGVKLLTLDATVLVSPAQLREAEVEQAPKPAAGSPAAESRSETLGSRRGSNSRSVPLERNDPVGSRLGLAARWIDDSADTLGELPLHA